MQLVEIFYWRMRTCLVPGVQRRAVSRIGCWSSLELTEVLPGQLGSGSLGPVHSPLI